MKITESQLRRIIRQEARGLREAAGGMPALQAFQAYIWDELVALFPADFAEEANETLGASNKVTFGDAEWTLVDGELAEELLLRAWDNWSAEYGAGGAAPALPRLAGSLVALRG